MVEPIFGSVRPRDPSFIIGFQNEGLAPWSVRERRGVMCDCHGSLAVPTTTVLKRRSFLKASAMGTIAMAIGGGAMGLPGSARAAASVKATHGSGFCNVAFFIAHARQLAKNDGLTLEFVNTPSFADEVTFL